MKKYKIAIELLHTWQIREEMEIDVEAETDEEAIEDAKQTADEDSDPDPYNCEDEDYIINFIKIISIDDGSRCKKTQDLFGG